MEQNFTAEDLNSSKESQARLDAWVEKCKTEIIKAIGEGELVVEKKNVKSERDFELVVDTKEKEEQVLKIMNRVKF